MAKTKIKFELVGLIDRSASMGSMKDVAQDGFNKFIDEQKALGEPCKVTLYEFDNVRDTVWERQPIADVGRYTLKPRNGTALLDALGQTIQDVKDKPDRNVIVVVVTDGGENASNRFSLSEVGQMVSEKQNEGWLFVFIGAGIDAFSEARNIGVNMDAAMEVSHTAAGYTSGYAGVSGLVTRSRMAGTTKNMAFTAEEREAAVQSLMDKRDKIEGKKPPAPSTPESTKS